MICNMFYDLRCSLVLGKQHLSLLMCLWVIDLLMLTPGVLPRINISIKNLLLTVTHSQGREVHIVRGITCDSCLSYIAKCVSKLCACYLILYWAIAMYARYTPTCMLIHRCVRYIHMCDRHIYVCRALSTCTKFIHMYKVSPHDICAELHPLEGGGGRKCILY